MDGSARGARLVWPTLATLVALTVLIGLGGWQWQRKQWKEELIATIDARLKAPPIDAAAWRRLDCRPASAVGLAKSCEYIAVRLSGTFDHGNERHVFTGIAPGAAGSVGGQGYWVVTPFRLAGSGETIAVSRGFVPDIAKAPPTRAIGQIAGETTIVGLVRESEPRGLFTGANDPTGNIWFLRNPGELFAGHGVTVSDPGHFVDLLSPVPPGGLPAPTAGRVAIPNRHLEYALTWWGLACTLISVYSAFAAGRLRQAKRG